MKEITGELKEEVKKCLFFLVFRIIPEDINKIEAIFDDLGIDYDYDGSGRMIVSLEAINLLEDKGLDYTLVV